ncbi:WD40 repeat-like protein [Delitschia confertaspora ATCC 74209]|uniref:WD40 repeat-like protein n=1 Tax=Delitschia confertaspora ATCC 74209 TaxID=1513339 RepID=A0A9P4JZC4_9PLEO|nr:WD40 repeat-like protein [Delitschia confertaspora ATCC 74209]
MDIHRARFVPYPPSAINALAFSHTPSDDNEEDSDCLRLAIGRANGNVEIWNPAKGTWLQEKVFSGGKDRSVEGLAWIQDPDEEDEQGKVVPGRLRLFSIGYSSSVTEWDLVKGIPARHSNGNHSEVWCFAAQPRIDTSKKNKGAQETPMVQNLVAGCADGTLVLLSTADDELRFDKFLSRPSGKRARVLSVTYKDRNTVVAGFADSMIRVFDTRNGQTIRNISLGSGPPGGPKDILVWKVKCLPNGDLVSGDSTGDLRFYDGKNYSQFQRISGHEADILDLSASRDGTMLFSGGMDRRTSVYTCSKKSGPVGRKNGAWRKLSHKRYHDHDVKAMATYDGKTMSVLVSGGIDTQTIVVPIRGFGKELSRTLPTLPANPPLTSATGARLMVSWWNCELRIWRVKKHQDVNEKPKMVARLALRGDENITSATISKDGTMLATSTASGVKFFQLSTSKSDSGTGLRIKKLESPDIPGAKLVTFSADRKWLAIVTHDGHVLLARVVYPTEELERPRIVTQVVRLPRFSRPSERSDCLNGSWGLYNRSITHAEFSADSTSLAVADIAGYIDSWVIQGYEDFTAPEVDIDETTSISPEDDDESDNGDAGQKQPTTIMGQRWILNPSGHLLPRVDSTPLLLSFEPTFEDSRPQPNGNPAVHPTRNNPHPHSQEVLSSEQRLLVVTAQHSIYEFELLVGRLSEWSRRNPRSSYPQQFRILDNLAKGCVWDVTEDYRRIWLYGERWLFMFDLSQDLPLPGGLRGESVMANGDSDNSPAGKKRKRDLLIDTPRKGKSGAGDAVPDKEAPVTKIRKLISGEAGKSSGPNWVDLDTPKKLKGEDDDSQHALTNLRRAASKGDEVSLPNRDNHSPEKASSDNALKVTTREPWWHTFKYRPILGIVPISEDSQRPEVVLVERPSWDLDLPPRFVGRHE